MGGKRLTPKPGSRSAVRPPTGYCARCALVEKLLSRMAGMVTLRNCERTSGSGWRTTVTRRPARQAVWCRRPSRNGLASRSVSAISTRFVLASAWEAAHKRRGKKLDVASSSPADPQRQAGAGGLLLVAAAQETGLLSTMETAVARRTPCAASRLAHLSARSRHMLVRTLLFLG